MLLFRSAALAASILATFAGAAHAGVEFPTGHFEVGEADGHLQIPVVLTAQESAAGPVTVNYRTVSASATPGVDYQTTGGTLIWEKDNFETKYIDVPLLDDATVESTESFSVELFGAEGAPLGDSTIATIDVLDDDSKAPGELQFSATDILAFEGSGTINLRVRRVNGSSGAISVEVTRVAGGTASPGTDFSDSAQMLTWADGETGEKTFPITIVDDAVPESTETVLYSLINPTGGASIARGTATVSIGDNDFEGPGEIRVLSSALQVVEGQATVNVPVGRFGGSNGSLSVNYVTQPGTATAADYTPVAGVLTWADGDTAVKTITIAIASDSLAEGTEDFALVLSPIGTAQVTAPQSTVSIIDDDEAVPTSTAALSAQQYTATENDNVVLVTVTRSNGDGAGSVDLVTAEISAKDGEDYVGGTYTVNFADGQTTREVGIPLIAHANTGSTERAFLVSLQNGQNISVSTPDSAIVRILPPQLSVLGFEQTSLKASDAAGQVRLVVRRLQGTSAISIDYHTVSATAVAGTDFTEASGTLNWGVGDMLPREIVVAVQRSADPVPNRTFSVVLGGGNAALLDGAAVATVTLESDAAKESDRVGGCTVGRADGLTFGLMVLTSLLWLSRKQLAHLVPARALRD